MIRLAAKFVLLALILGVVQAGTSFVAPGRGVPTAVFRLEHLTRGGADVLYFGDSTLYRGAPGEESEPTLPERVDALLPDLRVAAIAHDAYSPRLYAEFAELLSRLPQAPERVIIPVNLRSFSVERDLRPEYQFRREAWFLRHENPLARAAFHPLASWSAIDLQPVSQEEFESTPVYDGDRVLGTVASLSPSSGRPLNAANTPSFASLCYEFELTDDHRQLTALVRTAATLKEAGIAALFYITPVDVDLGGGLVPWNFQDRIEANAATLEESLENVGAEVLNLATTLSIGNFALTTFPDAYLNGDGKDAVARRLADTISSSSRDIRNNR